MGFGVALIGYACLLLHEIGGGFFAALILGYGFFLTSRLNKTFLHAAISALFILPRGVVQLLYVFHIVDLGAVPTLNVVTFLLFIAAWMMTTFFWLKGVIEIARDCAAPKLENQARSRLVITICFLTVVAAVSVLNSYGFFGDYVGQVNAGIYLLQYAVIFIDLLFMHTCFVLITSERQYAKDKQQIAIERAKEIEKKHKAKQEGAKRFENRK